MQLGEADLSDARLGSGLTPRSFHSRLRNPPAQRSSRRRSNLRCAGIRRAMVLGSHGWTRRAFLISGVGSGAGDLGLRTDGQPSAAFDRQRVLIWLDTQQPKCACDFNRAVFAFAFFCRRQVRELLAAISRGQLDCPCPV